MTNAEFWHWFLPQQGRLRSLTPDAAVAAIAPQVAAVSPFLGVEVSFSAETPELIITAEGVSEHFGEARALVAAAPPDLRWTIYALKPERGFEFKFEFGGVSVDASRLVFTPLSAKSDPDKFGIMVALPPPIATSRETALEVACLLVQIGIGEELFSTIDHFDVVSTDAEETSDWLPLTDLPRYLEWRKAQRG